MTARYFHKGRGHSFRGAEAREQGAKAWSRLPARLRRGLKSAEADTLCISQEWHHAGKYASEVTVYYPEQVEAFWNILDEAELTAEKVLKNEELYSKALTRRVIDGDLEATKPFKPIHEIWIKAIDTAEEVRLEITGE